MESEKHRSVGLICLASTAALLSLVLTYAGIGLFFQIGPLLNHGRYKPDYYPLGHVVLVLAGICLLVAAWIAAAAAIDLWKLRKRGRSLAIIGASILGVFALLAIVLRPVWDLQMGVLALIVVFCVEVIVYLSLRATRSYFEAEPRG